MLPQAIESLVLRRLEHLTERISTSAFHFDRREGFSSALVFTQEDLTVHICKPDLTSRSKDIRLYFRSRHRNSIIILFYRKPGLFLCRYDDQTFGIRELPLRCCRQMDNLFTNDLETYQRRAIFRRLLNLHAHAVLSDFVHVRARTQNEQRRKQKQFGFHISLLSSQSPELSGSCTLIYTANKYNYFFYLYKC